MIADPPVVSFRFKCHDGTLLEVDWTMKDLDNEPRWPPDLLEDPPPAWLLHPKRSWPEPGGPVVLRAEVKQGAEEEARFALGLR